MSDTPYNKSFPVSWDQFHRDARALAWRLAAKGPFEAIVCITRGGLVPAAIVARELNLRVVETLCIASYDETVQGSLKVLKSVAPSIAAIGDGTGKGVLLVDDLTDTGNTARVVRQMLPNAHFATVYAKPAGAPLCDTFITEVSQDTWIYLPWDLDLAYAQPIDSARRTPPQGSSLRLFSAIATVNLMHGAAGVPRARLARWPPVHGG